MSDSIPLIKQDCKPAYVTVVPSSGITEAVRLGPRRHPHITKRPQQSRPGRRRGIRVHSSQTDDKTKKSSGQTKGESHRDLSHLSRLPLESGLYWVESCLPHYQVLPRTSEYDLIQKQVLVLLM